MDDYLQALTQQLRVAAPRAVAILLDQAPRDATILMAAVEAASLLRDADWLPPDEQALAAQVLAEATLHSGPMAWLLSDALDLASLSEPPGPGPALETWLDHLVALAAVAPYLPTSARRQVDVLLEESGARAFTSPVRLASLSEAAHDLMDMLELPDAHPVTGVLVAIAAAQDLVAVETPVAALRARLAATAVECRGGSLHTLVENLRAAFGDTLGNPAQWLAGQLSRPAAAWASTDAPPPAPPQRHRLIQVRGGELSLVLHGGRLLVEWAAEDALAPLQIMAGGLLLDAVDPLVPGCPCWVLPSRVGPLHPLRLGFADGSTEDIGSFS